MRAENFRVYFFSNMEFVSLTKYSIPGADMPQGNYCTLKLKNHRVDYELWFINEHEKINIGCHVLLMHLE